LSNIVLDEFDRELERRGLRFARYADDSNIYVRSRRAGECPVVWEGRSREAHPYPNQPAILVRKLSPH